MNGRQSKQRKIPSKLKFLPKRDSSLQIVDLDTIILDEYGGDFSQEEETRLKDLSRLIRQERIIQYSAGMPCLTAVFRDIISIIVFLVRVLDSFLYFVFLTEGKVF